MNEKVLATGGWPDLKKSPCPSNPRPGKSTHCFGEISRKPSGAVSKRTGKSLGEYLVTSKCKFCGAIINDCPTIYV